MFSNSQNNIFTDDMEFALGASCSEFSVPNHLASLPYMLDDFEKKYDNVQSSFEEKLQADKKSVLSTLNINGSQDDMFGDFKVEDDDPPFQVQDLLFDRDDAPSPEVTNNDDDDFESREELIEEVNKLLFALEPQTTCPLESEDIDARDRQLTEDFIDELFKATLEAEKNDDTLLEDVEASLDGFQSEIKVEDIEYEQLTDDQTSIIQGAQFQVVERDFENVTIIVIQDSFEEATTVDMDGGIETDPVLIDEDSDPSWTPQNPEVKKRHYFRRSPDAKHKLAGVDKKERKKRQNVEAARRYRDKKKNEQYLVDGELEELVDLNTSLKQQVSERTNELKTLLKIMTDLGMIKPKKK